MLTVRSFKKMKKKNEPIVMLTAYDYPSAKTAESAGIDLILVGDSLGMTVLGYSSTLKVKLEDIIHHTKPVRRGAPDTFIIADMPYMSYHLSVKETKANAAKLITEGNANAVKLEGGSESRIEAIQAIIDCEIPVVAHLGLTPQSINKFGGYKVQGKSERKYQKIIEQAHQVQEAGAFMLVLEGIPEGLGRQISETIRIPTIGIGAGRYTDGQVLVYHDILGLADFKPKFVKQYSNLTDHITEDITRYKKEVKNKEFPLEKHVYFPMKDKK